MVLALPSRSEGMGRVIIEAFVRGRPVVGADVGGIGDLVTPGRNGLLAPPGDDTAFADALAKVLTDSALATRLATGAARDAERLRWTADKYAGGRSRHGRLGPELRTQRGLIHEAAWLEARRVLPRPRVRASY